MFRSALALVVAAVMFTACGGGPVQVRTQPGPGSATPSASASETGDPELTYSCAGVEGTAEELTEGPTLDGFSDHPAYETFSDQTRGAPTDWVVVEASEDRLAGVRELGEPERMDDQLRTHERAEVSLIPDEAQPHTDEDTWMLSSAGACSLQADLGRFGSADLALDPASTPDPDDRTLDLLVTESACAGGEPATGRVEVVDIAMTEEQVRLMIGVEPKPGGQDCPSNPATPVSIELPEPIGDRTIVDAAVLPPKELVASEDRPYDSGP